MLYKFDILFKKPLAPLFQCDERKLKNIHMQ